METFCQDLQKSTKSQKNHHNFIQNDSVTSTLLLDVSPQVKDFEKNLFNTVEGTGIFIDSENSTASKTISESSYTTFPNISQKENSIIPNISDNYESEMEQIVKNEKYSLNDRVRAYEDVVESQVGGTILSRAKNIERELGVKQIFLKFEGGNPTGTQKDRVAFAQVKDALKKGYKAITVATCGNYGASLSLAASLSNMHCIIYIPQGYHTKRIIEMEKHGAQIIRVSSDYENAVKISQEHAHIDGIYDANPGGPNSDLQFDAYSSIAYEIYDELKDAPKAVALPVSNGTTLVGVHRGFWNLYKRGKTSRMPKIIAGSSYQKNPIVQAFIKKTPFCQDLAPDQIHETLVNEPLVNWHSIDGDDALYAIRSTGGWASYASDKDMTVYSRLLRDKEGLNVLPASTAGLIALLSQTKDQLVSDRYVVVLTARKP